MASTDKVIGRSWTAAPVTAQKYREIRQAIAVVSMPTQCIARNLNEMPNPTPSKMANRDFRGWNGKCGNRRSERRDECCPNDNDLGLFHGVLLRLGDDHRTQ